MPSTTTTYSPTTGALTSVTNGTQTQTTGYDTWGRTLSQTDGATNTTTTTYDGAGRVATANDGKGTYAYSYQRDRLLTVALFDDVGGHGNAPPWVLAGRSSSL